VTRRLAVAIVISGVTYRIFHPDRRPPTFPTAATGKGETHPRTSRTLLRSASASVEWSMSALLSRVRARYQRARAHVHPAPTAGPGGFTCEPSQLDFTLELLLQTSSFACGCLLVREGACRRRAPGGQAMYCASRFGWMCGEYRTHVELEHWLLRLWSAVHPISPQLAHGPTTEAGCGAITPFPKYALRRRTRCVCSAVLMRRRESEGARGHRALLDRKSVDFG